MSQIYKTSSGSGPLPPNVPTAFVTDSGTATPSANILQIVTPGSGTELLQTSAPGSSNIVLVSPKTIFATFDALTTGPTSIHLFADRFIVTQIFPQIVAKTGTWDGNSLTYQVGVNSPTFNSITNDSFASNFPPGAGLYDINMGVFFDNYNVTYSGNINPGETFGINVTQAATGTGLTVLTMRLYLVGFFF